MKLQKGCFIDVQTCGPSGYQRFVDDSVSCGFKNIYGHPQELTPEFVRIADSGQLCGCDSKDFLSGPDMTELYATPVNSGVDEKTASAEKSKYHVKNTLQHKDCVDFYDLWDLIVSGRTRQVGDTAVDHAVKKLYAPGMRHDKDRIQDLEEAAWSINRAIEQIKESQDED